MVIELTWSDVVGAEQAVEAVAWLVFADPTGLEVASISALEPVGAVASIPAVEVIVTLPSISIAGCSSLGVP